MRRLLTTTVITLIAASPALANELSVTIYGDGRALVTDIRDTNFKRGEQVVELPGVSSQIQPQTATFVAAGVGIMEQNFDFDLLSPSKMMEKAVGNMVTIVRTNPGTGQETREKAKVLSVNNGVIIEVDGKIEVLRDDNIPTRVIFDDLPANLRANPTLSIMVDSNRPGSRDATLTYLTGGLNWRADYVMVFDEKAEQMDLQGWATLTNNTKTTFEEADVSVVAGVVGNSPNNYNQWNNRNNRNFRQAGTEQSPQERIGDNYLYPLPGKITVRSNQTKQVGIVDATEVGAQKIYEYRARGFQTNKDPQSADVRIAFSNSRAAGLGEALPKGTIRVYARDEQGRAQFIGEDNITHIPGGSNMALKIGDAFDVKVKPTMVDSKQVSRRVREVKMNYEVTNATDEPITVFVRQDMPNYWADYTILAETIESTKEEAFTYRWAVDVAPEGETNLSFTVREKTRW